VRTRATGIFLLGLRFVEIPACQAVAGTLWPPVNAPYSSGVKKTLWLLARGVGITTVTFAVGFLAMHVVRQTAWYKDYLYRQLLIGDTEQRLRAAGALALVGAEQHLLDGLKREEPEVRDLAQRGLEHLWSFAAGRQAFALTESAAKAAEAEDFAEALAILDRVTARYPKYAEGWNRRAAVHWQTGHYKKSLADCTRALALNPNHFGAWQGLGICQLQLEDVAEACRSLRVALEIAPHDETTRRCLRRCEEFLRSQPPATQPQSRAEWL
jgi:tetratricopeptide (TPR) repeat protein